MFWNLLTLSLTFNVTYVKQIGKSCFLGLPTPYQSCDCGRKWVAYSYPLLYMRDHRYLFGDNYFRTGNLGQISAN